MSPPTITVTNLINDEVLTHPLAIIRGTTTSALPFIHLAPSSAPTRSTAHPVVNGRFTALIELHPGPNPLLLAPTPPALLSPTTAHRLLLVHHPPPVHTLPRVRLVYLLASDSDGSFQSPDPPAHATLPAALARLRTAALLIQSATADMLSAHALPHRTFHFLPTVHVHRLALPLRALLPMSGSDLWNLIVQDLAALPHRHHTIDLAVLSFTRLQSGRPLAHTALGGGPLALFGGASLFTWPASVSEIVPRLRDTRRFDPARFFDDSAGRAASMGRRAVAATTIGALLHELGHCLSLPHPTGDAALDGGGIMARGFDHIDRLFVQPAPHEPLPFWDRGSALRLRHHRYLQFEAEHAMRRLRMLPVPGARPVPTPSPAPRARREDPPVFAKGWDGTVVCTSPVGIGHVGYYKNGDNASHEEFVDDMPPNEFRLPPLAELRRKCRASIHDKLMVSAIDVDGRITDQPYDEL